MSTVSIDILNHTSFIDNKTVSHKEMINCMLLMCGGTFQEKIQAAFILLDQNSSNTLNYNELSTFLVSVFRIFDSIRPKGKSYL